MRMRTRIIGATAALAMTGALGFGPAATAVAAPNTAAPAVGKAAKPAATSLPVTGTLADGTAFSGALSNLDTQRVGNALQMTGTITGAGLPAGGTTFTAPIQSLAAPEGCSVLNLDLGPLDLDLLGLVINLAPVSLDVTAVPGAGNLLGNLVCAISGLLDAGGPLGGLTALLDRLLSALGLGAR